MQKLFVIRQYIMAKNAKEAIRKAKKTEIDECWIDEKFKENNLSKDIGFKHGNN